MIDLLYVSHNRVEMTRASIDALIDNTGWDVVATLFILDDQSTDDTMEYLHAARKRVAGLVDVQLRHGPLGGPVAAMNYALDHQTAGVNILGKIDNDFVVPPGWLPELLRLLDQHPEVDVLGFEPFIGDPQPCPYPGRTISEPVRHVGGKGLIRTRIFDDGRPEPHGWNGYQGWSQYQEKNERIVKVWAAPDLQAFGLDQLSVEPWHSLTDRYVADGLQRRWPDYADPQAYAGWWLEQQEETP